MSYYRLYFMHSFSGHIERFEEFDALDDLDAGAIAKTHEGSLAIELWCGHRKVARHEALDVASQLLAQRAATKAVKEQIEPGPGAGDEIAVNRSG